MVSRNIKAMRAPCCLYSALVICFLLGHSDGFTWINHPPLVTDVRLGYNVTLQWNYRFVSGEKLTISEIQFDSVPIALLSPGGNYSHYDEAKNMSLNVKGKDNTTTVNIFDAKRHTEGKYCLTVKYVSNGSPVTKTECSRVNTFDYPQIIFSSSPKDITVNVSNSVALYCNASGKPTPILKWTRSSNPFQELSSSNLYRIQVNSSRDGGFYNCSATNKFGNDSVQFHLKVQYPPRIIKDKQIINATEGGNVTLKCRVDGYPSPDTKWIDNNTATYNGSEIDFPDVKRQYTGYYTCTARNLLGWDKHTIYLNILYKPEILDWTEQYTVNEGSNITLYCNTVGNPSPQVVWVKSVNMTEELVNGVGNVTLVINNVTKANAGEYFCNVTNGVATSSIKTRLIVQYKPFKTRLTIINGSNEIIVKGKLVLNCSAEAVPTTESWIFYRNDTGIANVSNGMFTKDRVESADGGLYKCIPWNQVGKGEQSNTLEIIILEPPTFLEKPSNTTIVNETEVLTLWCKVSGNPTPNVTWTKDNSSSNIGNGEKYTIPNASRSDAGAYTCTAKNGIGKMISASASIVVNYKPDNTVLVTNTGSNSIVVNETLVLYCRTQSVPPASRFEYFLKGEIIGGATQEYYSVQPVSLSNEGTYRCTPWNLLGEGTSSNNLTITVLVPPGISSSSSKHVVNEGESVSMRCIATGKPSSNITWTKDNSSDVINYGPEYTIYNTTWHVAGVYKCKAENGVRNPASLDIVVDINYKPIHTTLNTNTGSRMVVVNDTLKLICKTQAFPRPTMFRFFLNGMIKENSTENTLTIKRASKTDGGKYTCTPGNILGNGESAHLNISILEPPILFDKPSNMTVNLNDTITLRCNATGIPSPNITWTKDGSSQTIYKGEVYNKNNAEKCDAGTYRCTANNSIKKPVYAEAFVAVNSLPETPIIKNIAISNRDVEIHWKQPTTNCSIAVIGYNARLRKKDVQDDWTECPAKRDNDDMNIWTCSLGDLETETSYVLRIFAKNKVGSGEPVQREFKTKGGDPPGSSDARKGGLSKQTSIIIGASAAAGLVLLIIIGLVCKKTRNHHAASINTPIELNPKENGETGANGNGTPNGYEGITRDSQDNFGVDEIEENKKNQPKDDGEVNEGKNNGKKQNVEDEAL